MELRDIEYFIAVAERGHVGRAAESLGLSQPALSKCLRRLEREMDAKLVKRTPKGVELTTVGAAFLSHVRRLRLSLDDIAHEVEDLAKGRAGLLRVGANSVAIDHVLPPVVENLLNTAPKVALKVTVGSNDVLVPALRSGQVELIISGTVASTEHDLAEVHLWDDNYFVYASTRHRLAALKRVTLADVARERWAVAPEAPPTLWLRRIFQDNGFAPPILGLETGSLSLRINTVATTDLLDFLPRRIVARYAPVGLRLAELRIKELAWRRPFVVRYRKDAYLSPAARRFIEILNSTAKNIAEQS